MNATLLSSLGEEANLQSDAMMLGRDPKTKEGLTDASIMNNMITFLVAGMSSQTGLDCRNVDS